MAVSTISFSKGGSRLPSGALKKVKAGMARDGVVAFENLFPMPLLERIRAHVLRRHESGVLRRKGLIRDIGGRYAALLPFEGPFLEKAFYGNPAVLAMMRELLGKSFCLGSLETVISLPGSSRQHQHIDGPVRFDGYKGDLSDLPPYAVTLCVPLCDVDEENGPTAIWLGSHREALSARPPGERAVARKYREEHMAGPFGRAFAFDFRVFHGGMPNYTPEPRPLLIMVFVRSWFRDPNHDEVQPSVIIRPRDYARVPAPLKPLFMLAPAARRALWS